MDKAFTFKEIDTEGQQTLEAIAQAYKFNEWMYQTIVPYTQGKILEVGSGIGNISQFFLKNGQNLYVSDIRKNYCNILKERFASYPNLGDILLLDLVHPHFDKVYAKYLGYFDSVFALNVIEHIENDLLAINNSKKLLKPQGTLIILVPAYPALYNRFDEELFHYRRYTKKTLNALFEQNNITILKSFYFNVMGIPGWYISGKIQKNKTIPKNQMKIYEMFVPLFKLIDKLTLQKVGLSVVTVGRV
ncbi:MAG: class I SAM-dependent methyltransferase [Bacteroidia bacterium]|nr:class I SAM-dependent methyltransferase [Bacteroidia bacterium]MDW8158488.1 class I SAM-dependent methyltransferase [Bacteroidia bacterium]